MLNFKMILTIFILFFGMILVCSTSDDYCALPCSTRSGQIENSACDCGFGPKCEKDAQRLPPDEETKEYIVELHNQLRENVASGSYKEQPPASNMAALVYDDDLAHVAECYASKCIFEHDGCRRTEKFAAAGQNIMKGTGLQCDRKEVFSTSINLWFGEIEEATEDCIDYYTGCSGHYTQVVWAGTTSVGCARVVSGMTCLVFCNYGPVGNVLEQTVYLKGPPACETHWKYPHLCREKTIEQYSSARRLFLDLLLHVFQLLVFIYFGQLIW